MHDASMHDALACLLRELRCWCWHAVSHTLLQAGADELDPEAYRAACDLRARLADAAKARNALDTALRSLNAQQRAEEAAAVERALIEAGRWDEMLASDIAKARKALDAWRACTEAEVRLARALCEGASTNTLSRAIQDASTAGVKVQAAKKVLKLMQALEGALAAAHGFSSGSGSGGGGGGGDVGAAVRAKLEAAEQGGVGPCTLLDNARR